jgi:hypothetical protein
VIGLSSSYAIIGFLAHALGDAVLFHRTRREAGGATDALAAARRVALERGTVAVAKPRATGRMAGRAESMGRSAERKDMVPMLLC